ncbi:MAG: c-type cytochrome [Marinicella sp.]
MNKSTLLVTALLMTAGSSFAADIEAGKAKAAVCAACHGAEGISVSPIWPNLAGQKEAYLVKQIKAFKNGERKDPSMAPMVAALTDADIDNISAYYASLK